jgi:hypothetical protein
MKKLSDAEFTSLLTSAARAEAVTVLLKVMLQEMTMKRLLRLKEAARAEGQNIGHPSIIEEIDWLFSF